jgi:hypothetical protein
MNIRPPEQTDGVVEMSVIGKYDPRLITHLDITDNDASRAAMIVSEVAEICLQIDIPVEQDTR